jgi:probable phosphomutase (TIGR03848 family)
VTTVLLVRHGLTAQTGPILSGATPGLHLDERGQKQAALLAARLGPVPLGAVVSSPLERCRETAAAIAGARGLEVQIDDRLDETGYGDWTGRELKTLRRDPLWNLLMTTPSAVTFPNGEAFRDVQARAVRAVRDWNSRLGPDAVYAVCTHADVIATIAIDALGAHFDQIHRVAFAPASVSVIRYRPSPVVVRLNDDGSSIADLLAPPQRRRRAAQSGRQAETR